MTDVFRNFEKDGGFFAFAGQSNQAVTGMYNLYRACQVMFPGEEVLADARKFSSEFLQDKRANNELLDKWIIMKDLPGEVRLKLINSLIKRILLLVILVCFKNNLDLSAGRIRSRCSMVCQFTSCRNQMVPRTIWRRRRCLDWQDFVQVYIYIYLLKCDFNQYFSYMKRILMQINSQLHFAILTFYLSSA